MVILIIGVNKEVVTASWRYNKKDGVLIKKNSKIKIRFPSIFPYQVFTLQNLHYPKK